MSDDQPKTRATMTRDIGQYDDLVKALGKSDHDVAIDYGYSASAIRGWRANGRVPHVLVRGLEMELAASKLGRDTIIIGKPRAHVTHEVLHTVLQSVFEAYQTAQ